MSCKTYSVIPGEPQLGKVRECTYKIPLSDIIDKFIETWFNNGDYPLTVEVDGFDFEFTDYFNDNDIDRAEEYFRTTLDNDLNDKKFYELMIKDFSRSYLEKYEEIETQEYI